MMVWYPRSDPFNAVLNNVKAFILEHSLDDEPAFLLNNTWCPSIHQVIPRILR